MSRKTPARRRSARPGPGRGRRPRAVSRTKSTSLARAELEPADSAGVVSVVGGRVRPRVEPPHAHAVCRGCGRIADIQPTAEDLQRLEAIALRRPAGWAVEGVTLSATGLCPSCATRLGAGPDR